MANVAGSFGVNLVMFNLPFVPLLLSLCVAALSGGLGGLLANTVVKKIKRSVGGNLGAWKSR